MTSMEFDQKILVIRFSSIGDIVLATSAIRTIRSSYPKAQITFLTLDEYVPLLEYHPDIDFLLSINRSSNIKELWDFSKYLRRKGFLQIFDLHNSLRSKIVTFHSNAPVYQIRKPRLKRAMLFYLHLDQFESEFSTRKMYHQHIGPIWNDGDPIPPTLLRLSRNEIKTSSKLLVSNGILDDFIALVPGAAWRQKQWSAQKYIDTLNQLNLPVVLIGGEKDKICQEINEGLNTSVNLAGKTSLREAMAILALAKNIIGSDTGLMHAAEALGKPVSMILGPTSVQTGAGVVLPQSVKIEKDLWCRPCSQNGSFPCYRKQQFCMDSIEPHNVIQSLT